MADGRRSSERRQFLAGGAALTASMFSLHAPGLDTLPIVVRRAGAPDGWLDRLPGPHRQLFDSPEAAGGRMLIRMLDFFDTYQRVFGVGAEQIGAVGTLYSETIPYAVGDVVWTERRLGELLGIDDPVTGKPAVRNPWRTAPVVRGSPLAPAGIEALQRRGATFVVCNGALRSLAGKISERSGEPASEVHAELRGRLLPGLLLVPSMVIAIQQAQARGVAYFRQ